MSRENAPKFWETDSFSAGLCKSLTPAATRPHFINGAQKKTVLGPACRKESATSFVRQLGSEAEELQQQQQL